MAVNFNKIFKNYKKQEIKATEGGVIPEQINLIESVLEIIKKQLSDIDYIGKNNVLSNKIDELRRDELLVTKKRFLHFFYQVTEFLLEKIKTEKKENFRFYLPNLRTLFDIYSKLLFLANLNLDDQMLNCICERLDYLKKLSLEDLFKENYYGNYKPFLDARNYQIPGYTDFSTKAVRKYLFPQMEQRIKSEYVNRFKPNGFPKNIDLIGVYYNMLYRFFSGHVHGNILNKDSYGNEDLWVITNIEIFSSLIIKVVDIDILNNKNNVEIENWISDFKRRGPEFRKFYAKRRAKIS